MGTVTHNERDQVSEMPAEVNLAVKPDWVSAFTKFLFITFFVVGVAVLVVAGTIVHWVFGRKQSTLSASLLLK
jgi:hypothetical protein